MTNNDLERRLAEAVSHAAPNDFDRVLSRCEAQKGTVIQMTTKKRYPVYRNLIAACLALVIFACGGGVVYQQTFAVASVVSLDVNPSIELTVNKNEKVLECMPVNEDAKAVLADMNYGNDLKGAKLNVAVNAITGSLVRNGYLSSVSSAILISVEDNDPARAAKLQQELTAEVDTVLMAQLSEASVLSQTMPKDSDIEKQARENQISTGKASLIQKITEMNSSLSFDSLSSLSVEELKDLYETGAPGMPIGKQAAAEAAAQYAGISLQSVRYEVDAELDDVPPCYEVELETADEEYDYLVDAYTGSVLRGRPISAPAVQTPPPAVTVPEEEPQPVPEATQQPAPQPPAAPAGSPIGDSSALAAALAHAGVSQNKIRDLEIELDEDDGRLEYEIEFEVGNTEYEYTIDAFTGAVLEHEIDRDD